MMNLDDLGPRVCIMGPSNSGKSTLAEAISRARDTPVVHLDQLYHLPHTNWMPRPVEEFSALHCSAIAKSKWIVEGNYTRVLPQRLERATGLILLDVPTSLSLYRYFRRCWFEPERRGALEGTRDSVGWEMLHHITVETRANRERHQQIFKEVHLPKVLLASTKDLDDFYDTNGLAR